VPFEAIIVLVLNARGMKRKNPEDYLPMAWENRIFHAAWPMCTVPQLFKSIISSAFFLLPALPLALENCDRDGMSQRVVAAMVSG